MPNVDRALEKDRLEKLHAEARLASIYKAISRFSEESLPDKEAWANLFAHIHIVSRPDTGRALDIFDQKIQKIIDQMDEVQSHLERLDESVSEFLES